MAEHYSLYVQTGFAIVIAALVTHVLVRPVRLAAIHLGAVDYPGGRRKTQLGAVPRLGGVAIFCGFVLGSVAVLLLGRQQVAFMDVKLLTLYFGAGLIFLVGAVDDVLSRNGSGGVSAAKKFLFQLVAAALVVESGWRFEKVRIPFGETSFELTEPLAMVISVLWVVGVTNAINLIDGIDGLASGVVAIIATSFLVYALIRGDFLTVVISGAMVGACAGFLRHNFEPAKIFMGDSGSLVLGFLLAVNGMNLKTPTTVAILVPILALGVPVIDTLAVMVLRFRRPRKGVLARFVRMFRADRTHLHHHLMRLGMTRRKIVRVMYGAVFAFCLLSILVAFLDNHLLGLALLLVEGAVILGVRSLGDFHTRSYHESSIELRAAAEAARRLREANPR